MEKTYKRMGNERGGREKQKEGKEEEEERRGKNGRRKGEREGKREAQTYAVRILRKANCCFTGQIQAHKDYRQRDGLKGNVARIGLKVINFAM